MKRAAEVTDGAAGACRTTVTVWGTVIVLVTVCGWPLGQGGRARLQYINSVVGRYTGG